MSTKNCTVLVSKLTDGATSLTAMVPIHCTAMVEDFLAAAAGLGFQVIDQRHMVDATAVSKDLAIQEKAAAPNAQEEKAVSEVRSFLQF